MSQSSALDSFLDKWRTRWPEWSVAEPFIPEPQRRLTAAWFALLQEWEDIMNIAGDPLPADAKLAWWQQELRDWSQQRSRHPLGRVLEPVPAPWAQLADTLPAMQDARAQPQSLQQALARLRAFAEAVVGVEAALFARTRPGDATAVALQWLDARQRVVGDSAAPGDMTLAAWRTQLLRAWPRKPALARPHRVWSRLARLRLQRELAGKAAYPPPVQQLWHSWRAASGAD
ncbi:squalene/phytoene synthase family protein [Xanthomonas arboricola]|uniref:squalene/phytoene synthase family protein n=1 Tax=Xanthomonas arboricola TaxID=56448 RepID=UPI0007ED19C8|nr:squalene/phytoene synthase family protein [Xanthomonas arboricola]OBR76721.1 phytoene synthase [Xanthomonas arboricola]CAE6776407.1 hypothetical protein XA1311A_22910 [Xanthomonas arboricola]CAE6776426.1 hypothetical protein XA1311A_22910 [Xanthomonas arboricola]